jgi:type I restriction enzyme S subunit
MNAETLLEHFERISDAADAVPRLRRFVLDLAVRGKLVPQAVATSGDIATNVAERDPPVMRGRKRNDEVSEATAEDFPFPLPPSWRPMRLAHVAECLDHLREPINSEQRTARIAGKSPEQLFPYYGATQQQGWIDGYLFDEPLVLLGEDGVPFLDALRPKAYVIQGKTWVNNHAHVFRATSVVHGFLCHYLNVFDYTGRVAGATRAKLNKSKAIDIPIPLPPLAEQQRIVAKVDELMALCDRLEAAQAEREARRERLSAASLARVSQPAAADAMSDARAAGFHLDHFARLTTRLEHVKHLRQTILNLAVRGSLVPQDPADQQATTGSTSSIPDYTLPPSWTCHPLAAMLNGDSQNGYSKKPDDAPDGFPILRISAGTTRPDGVVSEEEYKLIGGITDAVRNQYSVLPGDLLACRFNGNKRFVGRLTLFRGYSGKSFIYPDKLIRLRVNQAMVLPDLLRHFGESDLVRAEVEAFCATTVGNWGISATNLKLVRIPLPPLAEQRRIVAKVDELMALCDQLEASLAAAATDRARLLESLLHEALATAA